MYCTGLLVSQRTRENSCLWAGIDANPYLYRLCSRFWFTDRDCLLEAGQTIRASGQESRNHYIPQLLSNLFFARDPINPRLLCPPEITPVHTCLWAGIERRYVLLGRNDTCLWAGIYVFLGRNIRVSGQEYTCFWAGISP